MSKSPIPSYRRQRRNGRPDLAFVVLGGRRHYLGSYDTEKNKDAYTRLLAEYRANRDEVSVAQDEITVVEMVARWWKHAEVWYSTRELENWTKVMEELVALYGRTRAADFNKRALKTVRETFIVRGCSRKYCNDKTARVKRLFKWATEEDLVPESVHDRIAVVRHLPMGRTTAPDYGDVQPVPEELIEPVRKVVPARVAAMIDFQLLTAARPGETVILRPMDIDTTAAVWKYRPSRHKCEHFGKARTIYIGPKCQEIIGPFLAGTPTFGFVFAPGDDPRKPYCRPAYGQAIRRGCRRAFPAPKNLKGQRRKDWHKDHHWSPNRLRHNAATTIREQFGLDVAQVVLGHAACDTTQIYAEVDTKKATAIVAKIG